jgi:hypothetical protein
VSGRNYQTFNLNAEMHIAGSIPARRTKENKMNQSEALVYAVDYLYNESCFKDHKLCRYEEGGKNCILDDKEKYDIHPDLRYYLCGAVKRFEVNFGEVNRKDIAGFIEAWLLSRVLFWEKQEKWGPYKGLVLKTRFSNLTRFVGLFPPND